MEIKALIVDDEPLAQQVILEYAKKLPNLHIAGSCADGICAHQFLQENEIDLLFLDINMPKLSGISFLKSLKNPPLTIFTTAYSEFALEGFELNALDYLKKPFSFERFCKAYFRAEELLLLQQQNRSSRDMDEDLNEFLFVKSDKKNVKIRFSELFYIEGLGDYIKLYLPNTKIVTNLSMKKLEQLLPPGQFYRIHKSFIVAIDKIEAIEGNMVRIHGRNLPVGNSYRQDFKQFVRGFMPE